MKFLLFTLFSLLFLVSDKEPEIISQQDFGRVSTLIHSPDGKFLASGGRQGITLINLENKTDFFFYGSDGYIVALDFSPDGKFLASADFEKNEILIWDAQSGRKVKKLKGHHHPPVSVHFSPNGKKLVSAGKDNKIIIWDLDKNMPIKSIEGHFNRISAVQFHPNGKQIVSASWDNTIKLWDVNTGKLVKKLAKEMSRVRSIEFSPNGKFLVYKTNELVKILDLSKERVEEFYTYASYGKAIFSSDNKLLAIPYNNLVMIFDWQEHIEIDKIELEENVTIRAVSFSPDNKKLAFAGSFGKPRITLGVAHQRGLVYNWEFGK